MIPFYIIKMGMVILEEGPEKLKKIVLRNMLAPPYKYE